MIYQIIAWVSGVVLGIGAIYRAVDKWSPKIKRAIDITDETLDVVRTVLNAIEDKKVTKQEVEWIVKELEELQEILRK